MRPKPAHPLQEDLDFYILLNIILFILYTETFLKVLFYLQFWGIHFYFGFKK